MKTFRVWAPRPKKVSIRIGSRTKRMTRAARGWWNVSVPDDSSDYGFVLDGEGPFPDPRSPWQPHGVHGLSRAVDHDAFHWTEGDFRAPPLSAAVIYEAHVGTFSPEGTFEGMIPRLDHLTGLGVTHLELMPVNEFPGERGWGYDGVDWYAPHNAYGGPEALKRLVDACHEKGLAVLLDVVYNHLGPSGNYLDRFGPYFNDGYQTLWGPAVNLDGAGSDEVRRFICDNALMWLRDYHFDGLRIDAVHAFCDRSAVPLVEQLTREVRALEARTGRPYVVVAESDLNDPRLLWSFDRGGCGLDAQWSDDFHHALHAVLTGEERGYYADFGRLDHLAKALQRAFVYEGQYSTCREKRHGRPAEGLSGRRFLGYLQNHDQVDNRAAGERSSHLLTPAKLKIGAALVLTSSFVPMLFQGEEWGATSPFLYFTSHPDKDLAKRVREGRRSEFAAFGWRPEDVPDPQARSTFLRSRLDWNERDQGKHAELLEWHRDLIRLRRSHPALADDRLESIDVRHDEAARWLTMERDGLLVAVNLASRRRTVPLPSQARRTVVMASVPDVRPDRSIMELPPHSVAILEK